MKEMRVNHIEICLLDDEDFEIYNIYSWHRNNSGYLRRTHYTHSTKKHKTVFLHRLIMNITDSNIEIDHINGNKLDNRKQNLRICTRTENTRNRRISSNRKYTKYKGVEYDPRLKKRPWSVSISVDGKRIRYGKFYTAKDAAIAYNKLAIEYFGEFAHLNQIERE